MINDCSDTSFFLSLKKEEERMREIL